MPVVAKVSKFSEGTLPIITGSAAGEVIVQHFFIDLVPADFVAGAVFDVGILPAYHTVVNMVIVSDDLDTNAAPLLTFDVGLLDGVPGDDVNVRNIGAEFFSNDSAAQSGATGDHLGETTGFTIKPTDKDRSIGVKIEAAAATAAAGRLRLLTFMTQADPNIQF